MDQWVPNRIKFNWLPFEEAKKFPLLCINNRISFLNIHNILCVFCFTYLSVILPKYIPPLAIKSLILKEPCVYT